MNQFLTLEGAWDEFLKQSNLLEVTGGEAGALAAAKDLFMAGCQGSLYAFANIKEHCENDGHQAVPYIMALYNEATAYVEAANARADEEEKQQAAMQAAWPFPTGARN